MKQNQAPAPLAPSWKIETSPGNEQWGYIFDEPIIDPKLAEQLVKAIIDAGYCDKGAGSPETRYMRLPVGSNGKPEHVAENGGKPVPHILREWNPDRIFSVNDIVHGLGLRLDFADDQSLAVTLPEGILLDEAPAYVNDEVFISQISTGENYHEALLTLSARYRTRGMSQKAIVETLRGVMAANYDDSERWKDRYKDITRVVAGAFEKFQSQVEDLSFVDFTSLAHTQPPARRWVVREWLPRGTVTNMSGKGGIGKTLIAQQLSIAVANGDKWLGLETTQGGVLGMFCEDDCDELLRRGSNIFSSTFIDPVAGSKELYLDARAGKINTLAMFGDDRQAIPTPLFSLLRDECAKRRPSLVILDNIAQMFGGSENDRYHVTTFCNLLTGLAIKYHCAILLLGHPAKADASEYSGSTAWEAAVRSRIFLGNRQDGTLEMKKAKANYSKLEGIDIEYHETAHVFVRKTAADEAQEVERAKPIILEALVNYTRRQDSCSHVATARNYLITKILCDRLSEKISKKRCTARWGASLIPVLLSRIHRYRGKMLAGIRRVGLPWHRPATRRRCTMLFFRQPYNVALMLRICSLP